VDDDRLVDVIDRIYAVPGGAGSWSHALAAINRLFDGCGANLVLVDRASRQVIGFYEHGIPHDGIADYAAYYVSLDPRLAYAMRSEPGPCVDSAMFDPETVEASEYFQDFYLKHGYRHAIGGSTSPSRKVFAGLLTHLPKHREHPDARALALMARLLPQVQRALQLEQRIAGSIARSPDDRTAVLDRFGDGLLTVDPHLGPLQTNAAADEILAQRDGLTSAHGEIAARSAAATDRLRKAVRDACCLALGDASRSASALCLPREDARPDLEVMVMPLPRSACRVDPVLEALIVAHRPERHALPPRAFLADLFGLTAREADLAVLLGTGRDLPHAAEALGIGYETARTYAKTIYGKIGVSGHAEFAHRLSALGGWRPDPGET